MQSQQKKVKWSRGETADALEERTDTGITQVSVSKMSNIIADIYGNISRRPAFKIVSSKSGATDIPVISGTSDLGDATFVNPPQSFVFTINPTTYIIFIADSILGAFGGLLIQDGKFVKKVKITYDNTIVGSPLVWDNEKISTAQYNNFMVVSHLFLNDVIFRLTESNDVTVEPFVFSAPWYAPGGTKSKTVSATDLPGLEFNKDGLSFTGFSWTDASGNSSPYSIIDTGLTGDVQPIEEEIPVGSIVKFGNLGCYMRVEGYRAGGSTIYFGQYTFDKTESGDGPFTQTGLVCVADHWNSDYAAFRILSDGQWIHYPGENKDGFIIVKKNQTVWVQCSESGSGYRQYNFNSNSWSDVPSGTLAVQMFGALLTPVANTSGVDQSVTVEYGYISLDDYQPTKLTFSNQRLYAAGFTNPELSPEQIPGYAVGSQIGRYNDFKNDYNTQSEAVVIDISTSYQEQIVAVIDYNGLKILTDAAEYSYTEQNGVVKQSTNGSLATCEPIIFGSVCLYADKSHNQIRAMQYELQTDLFTSSSINQMAQEDLVFNTTAMAGFLDKEHYNGRFLYATQSGYKIESYAWTTPKTDHSIAVCNMVPGNQAMIWARWTSPEIKSTSGYDRHSISSVIEVCNKVWFIVGCREVIPSLDVGWYGYTLAELDYEHTLDIETQANNTDTEYRAIPSVRPHDLCAWVDQNDPDNVVYTHGTLVNQGDPIYDADGNQISVADNNPGGPNITIGGVGYYAWDHSGTLYYTKDEMPVPTGTLVEPPFDESRRLYDENGVLQTDWFISSAAQDYGIHGIRMLCLPYPTPPIVINNVFQRVPSASSLQYKINNVQYTADYDSSKDLRVRYGTIPGAIVSVFDGDEYKWDDTLDENGAYTEPLTELTNARVGFMINAELMSHPIDVGGKTYTDHKRIGKCVAVTRDTEPGAFTVCDKTGYMDNDKKKVNFYGCTGMKDEVRYTIKNIQGAKFTIESLTMIIEYATLDS